MNTISNLEISKLHFSQFTVNGSIVASYMRDIVDGRRIDPVGCSKCPKSWRYHLHDGYHRIVATILTKGDTISASIENCEWCDELTDVCNDDAPTRKNVTIWIQNIDDSV